MHWSVGPKYSAWSVTAAKSSGRGSWMRRVPSRGKTMSQVAINWVLSHPEITAAISGSDAVEHVDDVIGGVGWSLSEAEITLLNEASEGMNHDI